LVTGFVFADVPADKIKEIDHLLNFIKSSNCIINRNGSDYPAEKGVNHIKNKYDYFRDDIRNAEDFIKYSATKSTMSGKFYTVKCPDAVTIKTQEWLLSEIQRYRSLRGRWD
jgi:hypothetical protein